MIHSTQVVSWTQVLYFQVMDNTCVYFFILDIKRKVCYFILMMNKSGIHNYQIIKCDVEYRGRLHKLRFTRPFNWAPASLTNFSQSYPIVSMTLNTTSFPFTLKSLYLFDNHQNISESQYKLKYLSEERWHLRPTFLFLCYV